MAKPKVADCFIPECGAKAKIVEVDAPVHGFIVQCSKCSHRLVMPMPTAAAAANTWNKIAATPPKVREAQVKALGSPVK